MLNSNGFGKLGTAPPGGFGTPGLKAGAHHPHSPQGVVSLWLPAPATGDPGGRPALRRDLLSGGQLDPPLGQTQGRGRMDRYHQADGSARKLLFVYPLCRDVQHRLRGAQPPCFSEVETEADWA